MINPSTVNPYNNRNYKNKSSLSDGSKIQEIFLNHCRKNRIAVKLHCKDQEIYPGFIAGFDQEIIVLEEEGRQNLHYKESIIRIVPEEKLDFLFNDNWRNSTYTN